MASWEKAFEEVIPQSDDYEIRVAVVRSDSSSWPKMDIRLWYLEEGEWRPSRKAVRITASKARQFSESVTRALGVLEEADWNA